MELQGGEAVFRQNLNTTPLRQINWYCFSFDAIGFSQFASYRTQAILGARN